MNMSKFFENINAFYGDGSKNAQGEDLDSFLEGYDPYKYKNPCVTVDMVVLRRRKSGTLELLMIRRKNHPCIGSWALPGGFVELKEDLLTAAKRELEEETGLVDIPMRQMHTWGDANRDPRGRIITVSYLAYIDETKQVKAGDDAADAAWVEVGLNPLQKDAGLERYELYLNNVEKQIKAKALVEIQKNKELLFDEPVYQILESNHIAFDHAKVILQALLYFQNK